MSLPTDTNVYLAFYRRQKTVWGILKQGNLRYLLSVNLIAVLSLNVLLSSNALGQSVTCGGLPATIIGTGGNDILTGTDGIDVILGLGGNDQIAGGLGNDIICGGLGNDTINGYEGNDTVFGDEGMDQLYGGPGDDVVYSGMGDDTAYGGLGNDKLYGGPGNDTLVGGPGNDTLVGGTEIDVLYGGTETDSCLEGETNVSCEGLQISELGGVNYYDPVLTAPESGYKWDPLPLRVTQYLTMMRANGFNVIRVPYNWESYVNNQANFLTEVELIAKTADENGLFVWFDNHQWFTSSYFLDTYTGFPSFLLLKYSKTGNYVTNAAPFWNDFYNNTLRVNGKSVWDHQVEFMAKVIQRVDKYNSVIGYEILNEPNVFDISQYEKLGTYHTYMAQKLRLFTGKTLIFDRELPLTLKRQVTLLPLLIPRGVSNVLFSPHVYSLTTLAFQVDSFKSAQQIWKDQGYGDIPVIIGEFSVGPPYSTGSQENMDLFVGTFKDAAFGWTYFAWGCFSCEEGHILVDSNLQPTIYLQYLRNSMTKYYN